MKMKDEILIFTSVKISLLIQNQKLLRAYLCEFDGNKKLRLIKLCVRTAGTLRRRRRYVSAGGEVLTSAQNCLTTAPHLASGTRTPAASCGIHQFRQTVLL
jgi:hypothetical protein